MINIAELVKQPRIPGNYFASDTYIRGDLELGLLETRRGDRLIALPETLIKAIYTGLEKETGQASSLVLYNCGKWWGKSFYIRFCEEVSEYYEQPISQMNMVQFIQCLQQLWKTNGWGLFELDPTYNNRGFLIVKITHSLFASQGHKNNKPTCFLEAGILSSFFSQLTGRELFCLQTTCESIGADANRFVLGLSERIKPIEAMVEQGKDHETIMKALTQN